MKFNWKIGGEAGFGIMTTGLAFSKIATRSGYHIFDYAEYPSLIRGGHNTYEVVVSDTEVTSMTRVIDLLVCLNKAVFEQDKHRLTASSMVIYDAEEFEPEGEFIKIAVPFQKFKKEFQVQQIMVNTMALGASLALLGGEIDLFYDMIRSQFGRKGQEIVEFNEKLAAAGYDHVKKNYAKQIKPILKKTVGKEKMVMTANDAFSFAAVPADCRYYAAYPMTPSSSILGTLAEWQVKTGMVVRHSEDEIAVINSALGSSFAGVRSAVATSGGGFALMVEALSYAGIAEIPIVVYLGQRPGPATGMPTWTEQGDLLFAVHAGHGEFPKIVLAPGDTEEMIRLTTEAFDLADIYQTPVIIMSDKLIGESHKSIEKDQVMAFISAYKPQYGKKVSTSQQPYLRYKNNEDGISELLIPGQPGFFYQANSYEHLENSHTSEDAKARQEQVEKRNKKRTTYLKTQFPLPKIYGDLATAQIIFISWGGNKGAILEAQKLLAASGRSTALIHFTHVYPLDQEKIIQLFPKNKRYILIENNSQAQFGQLLRMQTGIDLEERLLKYDGRPFWPEEIVEYVRKTINN